MATPDNQQPTTSNKQRRKPRGKAIEKTALMQALEDDRAATMMQLADEAQSEWEEKAPPEYSQMIAAQEEDENAQ